jgi:hypothetical protein
MKKTLVAYEFVVMHEKVSGTLLLLSVGTSTIENGILKYSSMAAKERKSSPKPIGEVA